MQCPFCGFLKTKKIILSKSWSITACLNCTNAWTCPPPGYNAYDEQNFHGQFKYETLIDLPSQWQKGVQMQINLLVKSLKPGASILEIGCGQGILLMEMARRGFAVTGIEPSITASQAAQEAGLNVIFGYFPHPQLTGPFDAVIMSHVLEHLSKPLDILQAITQIAFGGHVLLVQTNWSGLIPRIYREKWYAWVPEQHFWHFTPKGLGTLMQSLNWEIVTVEYSSLEHQSTILSRIGASIPGLGDQFHLLARIP